MGMLVLENYAWWQSGKNWLRGPWTGGRDLATGTYRRGEDLGQALRTELRGHRCPGTELGFFPCHEPQMGLDFLH